MTSRQDVAQHARPAWPGPEAVVLATTEGSRYASSVVQVAQALMERRRYGVVVCANRGAEAVRISLERGGLDVRGLRFIDCISTTSGVPPPPDASTLHIESPTMLEKVGLRAEQWMRRLPGPGFLLVDSVSTMAVYNGPHPVVELVHNLVMRLHGLHAPAAFLLVERQGPPGLADLVRPLCDAAVHL